MELGALRDGVFATEGTEGTESFILNLGASRRGLTAGDIARAMPATQGVR